MKAASNYISDMKKSVSQGSEHRGSETNCTGSGLLRPSWDLEEHLLCPANLPYGSDTDYIPAERDEKVICICFHTVIHLTSMTWFGCNKIW